MSQPNINTNDCWLYAGPITKYGYGIIWDSGFNNKGKKNTFPHRAMYEAVKGKIPDGLQLDHLCRVTQCINPAHLEAVTSRINTLRSNGLASINARKTHCFRGHEFTEQNTRIKISPKGVSWRMCRKCGVINVRKYRLHKERQYDS